MFQAIDVKLSLPRITYKSKQISWSVLKYYCPSVTSGYECITLLYQAQFEAHTSWLQPAVTYSFYESYFVVYAKLWLTGIKQPEHSLKYYLVWVPQKPQNA